MQVGLIGAGNMARALARGWGDPVLCTDSGSGRAPELADELGGEALASNAELAERADLVVLAHKPAQLDAVAAEVGGRGQGRRLAAGPHVAGRRARGVPRACRSSASSRTRRSQVGRGRARASRCPTSRPTPALQERVRALFARSARSSTIPERLMPVAGACWASARPTVALLVEAQVDAAVQARACPPPMAAALVTETMAGSAELIRARERRHARAAARGRLAGRHDRARPGRARARRRARRLRRGHSTPWWGTA